MPVTINASTSTGLVQSADTSGEIELQSNGTTALKVNTNEGIQILNCLGVGNATPSTSGAGITFPATQSASSDGNTLDDYEEGSWTPTLGGTATYTERAGGYTKIGRIVFLHGLIIVNSLGTGNTLEVLGLPFVNAGASSGSVSYFDNLATSVTSLVPFTDVNNSDRIRFRALTAAAATMSTPTIFKNGTRVDFFLAYTASN